MAAHDRKAVIVGISGCSSSGKTTLARLLRDIFPNTFILHEDDFYKPDKDIPVRADGLADWDCPEALSLPDMQKALAYIRAHGVLPVSHNPYLSHRTDHGGRRRRRVVPQSSSSPSAAADAAATDATATLAAGAGVPAATAPAPTPASLTPSQSELVSKEDQNSVGPCPVSDEQIAAARAKVQAWLQPGQPGHVLLARGTPTICLLDGFLLYGPVMQPVMDLLDVRLFLRVSRAQATHRRHARDGYVTLEGFWQDPPGYMDKVVWPNYVAAHAWLFADSDVEGRPAPEALQANQILTQVDRGNDVDMATTLAWAVDTLLEKLEHDYL
ncbi:nicotinamide riboside kinase [Niveomyces insectorum RCEF 264]|uniref:Nicotinamide riboside kinase n=1 Tax=Niveomyces insectorum RCEF 264 TaxID=1081102 RepID=A0A167NU19_9HYPO|nr:nicotinamide riboside kinase [Niveomyces insectorum RCEF 264]